MGIGTVYNRLRSCIWREEDQRLELLLFRLLCLAATVLSFLVVMPADYLAGLPVFVNLATALFGLGTLLLSRQACRGRYYIKTLLFLFLALLNLVWFPNGGSHGSVSYYLLCAFLYIPIFFRGRTRWLLLAGTVLDVVSLHVAEFFIPQWLIAHSSFLARGLDLVVGQLVSALACSLMLWVLLMRYDQEQRRLTSLNQELHRNIAERSCVEAILLQERELLNAVMDGTTDAIFVKNVQGQYILFNSAAAAMTGQSVAVAIGKDDTEIFPPEQAREIMEVDRSIMEAKQVRTVQLRVPLADGGVRVFETTKGPLQDGQGNTVGLFGVSRDITESHRMSEELYCLNQELERRVTQRTARLEAAVREQETFSYSVSHDLRGPLRHINSYTAILEEDFGSTLPLEAREYMERIRSSSRRMGNLIDDLLELSRIGRSELVKTPVCLSRIGGAIGAKLKEAEPARRVDLIIEPDLQANGDQVLVGQMLENLIGNAWKYSSVREHARIELGRCVVDHREAFFVRDNGAGFDMAYQDKLFGPFQRLHGAEFEGTGIGLATVKRIVERHDGSVWAHGVVDQGATIYFTLG